jgi:hypothetical protein
MIVFVASVSAGITSTDGLDTAIDRDLTGSSRKDAGIKGRRKPAHRIGLNATHGKRA